MPTTIDVRPHGPGTHAVVIGGSIAGLLAARVLTDHFDRVTLIERDRVTAGAEQRKGVPQARHGHHLLSKGVTIVSRLFPDLPASLVADGATMMDLCADARLYHSGQYLVRFPSDMLIPLATRAFLEQHLRRLVLARHNLALLEDHSVSGLIASPDRTRVTGVAVQRRAEPHDTTALAADLVVDASGRGSRSPRWLEALGYARPDEIAIKVNVGYASRVYRPTPGGLDDVQAFFLLPKPPHETRGGVITAIEGGRWLVTLAGWLGDHPPADEPGFLAYARSLPAPDIYRAIQHAAPLSDIFVHKFPTSLRRRYEQLARFPAGFIVMGDALCSFNPIYGQGMTVAALEAEVLDSCLREQRRHGSDARALPRGFFRRAAQVIETPWLMATGVDLQFPQIVGARPLGSRMMNMYVRRLQHVMMTDPLLARTFFEVMQLLRPPTSLFAPRIVARVVRGSIGHHAPVKWAPEVPLLEH